MGGQGYQCLLDIIQHRKCICSNKVLRLGDHWSTWAADALFVVVTSLLAPLPSRYLVSLLSRSFVQAIGSRVCMSTVGRVESVSHETDLSNSEDSQPCRPSLLDALSTSRICLLTLEFQMPSCVPPLPYRELVS